jgi:GNAT superfamily N-acetyltransferase
MRFTICTKKGQKLHSCLDWKRTINSGKLYTIIRARDGKKLAGQIAIDLSDGDAAWIYWLVVNPKIRGKGIGTELMQRAEDFIASENIHKIYLHAQKEFEDKLVPWYEGLGYEKLFRDKESKDEWLFLKEF